MNTTTIANYFMTLVSLVTAMGVFMHDSRIDKASSTALSHAIVSSVSSAKAASGRYNDVIASDAHAHPDHNTANRSLLSSFSYQSPSIAPRRKSHHKELARLTSFSRHAFDNANLPLLD